MSNTTDTSDAGTDFDGTANNGEIVFNGTTIGQDSTRAIIYSLSVTTDGTNLSEAMARLGPDLASVTGNGPFLEMAIVTDAAGFTMTCCRCVVPAGWKLFILTTEGAPIEKKLFVDWSVESLVPRF